jgi:hypothetical protein
MQASRARRVAALRDAISIAEARIEACEQALALARQALGGLRDLAATGASKVMP